MATNDQPEAKLTLVMPLRLLELRDENTVALVLSEANARVLHSGLSAQLMGLAPVDALVVGEG